MEFFFKMNFSFMILAGAGIIYLSISMANLDLIFLSNVLYLNYFTSSMLWLSFLLIFLGLVMNKGLTDPGVSLGLKMLSFILPVFFLADHALLLFCLLELSLLPLFLMILNSGYQPERLNSSILMFLYTVLGSSPLLYFLYYALSLCMSLNSAPTSWGVDLSYTGALVLLSSVSAFLVKVPMFSLHLWLPKAHVEAPVQGSSVLAGIMLKLGGYGLFLMLIKFSLLGVIVSKSLTSYCLMGALLTGLTCIFQKDGKSLIAYSSVVHMVVMVIGVIAMAPLGHSTAFGVMLGHGMASPVLFYIFFCFSSMVGTRSLTLLKGVGGLSYKMKLLWWLAIIANMACPPFLNLLMEVGLVAVVLTNSLSLVVLLFLVMLTVSLYSLLLYLLTQLSGSEWTLCVEALKFVDALVISVFHMFLIALVTTLQFYF